MAYTKNIKNRSLFFISIIYTLICICLINIKLLIRLNTTRLLFGILTIIRILLLTNYIAVLIYLKKHMFIGLFNNINF